MNQNKINLDNNVKRHPELTPWRHEELTPLVGCWTIEAAVAERVSTESTGGTRAGSERLPWRGERRRGGYLRAPVGEPRSRCDKPQSVSPKAARRLDAGQFVEIEINDGLQRLTGGAVA